MTDNFDKDPSALPFNANPSEHEQLIKLSPVIFVVLSPTGRILSINDYGAKELGYQPGELIGRSWLDDFIPADEREQLNALVEELHTGTENSGENSVYTKNGARKRYVWHNSFQTDGQGQIGEILSVGVDVTKRYEKQQSLQKALNELTDQKIALDEASIVAETNLKGRITYVNDRFCTVSGYSRDELLGNTHRMINSGHHPPEFFQELWQTITKGSIWKGEIKNQAKDGSFYWVDTTIVPFRDIQGKIYKYVSIRHETTPEKEFQAQLQNQIKVAEEALNASHLKSRFISELSHELRSALNSIMGFAEVLKMDNDNWAEEDQHYLKHIQKASQYALGLMNDVLDASRLEANKIVLDHSPFDLGSKVQEVMDMVNFRMERKGLQWYVKLSSDLPTTVVGDSYRLSQILINLLTNATKHTDEGSITLEAKKTSTGILFAVRDTGRGIPPEQQNTIFKEWEQCTPADAAGGGTGLGLAICKKLVELMKGRIWLESEVNKGSVFYTELPLPEEKTTNSRKPDIVRY